MMLQKLFDICDGFPVMDQHLNGDGSGFVAFDGQVLRNNKPVVHINFKSLEELKCILIQECTMVLNEKLFMVAIDQVRLENGHRDLYS